jgi:predicted transcriptional regulator
MLARPSRNKRQIMRTLVVVGRAEWPEADRWKGGLDRQPFGVSLTMSESTNHVELAAEIVSAYVSNNSVPSSELPALLSDVHAAIVRVATGAQPAVVEAAKPAVPPKKSITSDYIICLEDGRKFKSLKRHLRTQYNLSPEEYREKWGLPSDYPMVAPAYAKARSALAKQMGLGQQRRRRK